MEKTQGKKRLILLLSIFVSLGSALQAAVIRGKVIDEKTKEPLIGAYVYVREFNLSTVVGLDGSYQLKDAPTGEYLVEVSFIGYRSLKEKIRVKNFSEVIERNFALSEDSEVLQEVVVIDRQAGTSEAGARGAERKSAEVINVVSAKSIELSPDITVANVIQRVSGMTIERNSNGDGQYAIVRGMNKRYNYTLVNGIKIPSPDNENRYVPLDIFPSDLLDQLVVTKALSPSMEGDAIGGVVDMKLKDAPQRKMINVQASTGLSEIFTARPYDYFGREAVDFVPPMQRREPGQRVANPDLFSTENFNFRQADQVPLNSFASVALGNRFFKDRFGIVVAGSFQRSFRGADRIEFGISDNSFGSPNPRLSRYQERRYSVLQERLGLHTKMDYYITGQDKISFYTAFMNLRNDESRTILEDGLRGVEEPTQERNWRGQINRQRIYNSTLQGEHQLHPRWLLDWSLVYSIARQDMPDNSQLVTVSNYQTENRDLRFLVDENIQRIWESNSDRDYAAYLNLTYDGRWGDQDFRLKGGGLLRLKDRSNNFDLYTFKPRGEQVHEDYDTDYADIDWRITGASGTPDHVLNYDSYENVAAQYGQFQFTRWDVQFLGGVRTEYTDQGYSTRESLVPDGAQRYWYVLPSLHLKYMPNEKNNLKSSYFRSISRPSFLEIIPYRRPATEEIVAEGGNPNLVPVDAHNFDLRYEYFPTAIDQLLIGAFYKVINNPIERAILPATDPNFPEFLPRFTTMIPINLETAVNWGLELDVMKYFKRFGIRANYTFTDSRIESIKRTRTLITADNYDQLSDLQKETLSIGDSTQLNVTQSRPLQGQARHVGNISLLFKDPESGWDAQLAMVYTGERIAVVSAGLDTDWWQRDFIQLSFSLEKKIGKWVIFTKVNNILDTPYELYIKSPHMPHITGSDLQPNSLEETLVRRDLYGRNYMLGVKFKI